MKIKLAVLEKDTSYLGRITSVFAAKYADKLEIYSFTELSEALSHLGSERIDVFIANDYFDIDLSLLPKRCGFAYFVDSSEMGSVKGQLAIGKFQKAELIYKQVLSIFSEKSDSIMSRSSRDSNTKLIFFTSVSGGTGTSSMAAACALHFAERDKKTLYLNFEMFGSSDAFFEAGGSFNMSDIIFALKSRKSNLALKLESCVKHDPRGVYFYSAPKLALDMMELTTEEIEGLLEELKATGDYDFIVVDGEFYVDSDWLKIYRSAYSMVWVSDGSRIAEGKISAALSALSVKEQNTDSPISDRIVHICNNSAGGTQDSSVKYIGYAPHYDRAKPDKIISELSKLDFMDRII